MREPGVFGNRQANFGALRASGITLRGQRVLEVGCGSGYLCEYVRALGASVVGCDISLPETTVAPFVQADGVALPFRQSFDVVLSFDVFEHIPDSDRHLREVRRVLRPGGHYLLQTPNKVTNSVFETIRWRSFTAWRSDHCSLHTFGQLQRRLRSFGFSVRFLDIPVVNPYFLDKINSHVGPLGVRAVKLVNPDRFPIRYRTNFYVVAQAELAREVD
ncbi:MAG: class I SAM-dependent methyltransferase [Acidobacteria bacterium]|nr:class I SAM-dependent methyltransferase [Acidobacteriota bacterium]